MVAFVSADQRNTLVGNQLQLYSILVISTTFIIIAIITMLYSVIGTHDNLGNEDQLDNWILCILRWYTPIEHVVLD